MSFKKIVLCYALALPLCVAARIFQIVYATEYATGFPIVGCEWVGIATAVLVAVACIGLAILSFKTYKNPETPPKTTLVMSVSALVVAVPLLREVLFENMVPTMPALMVLLIKFSTVICAAYFVVFAITGFLGIKLPMISHAIPCIYAIIKTLATFMNISTLALIYDNLYLIAGYALLMLFFVNYGKLHNGIDTESGFRKLAATGLAASLVCLTQSIAVIIVNMFGKTPYVHTEKGVMWAMLGMGAFIIVFLCEYFYKVETEEEHI